MMTYFFNNPEKKYTYLGIIILITLFAYICGPLFSLSNFGPGDDLVLISMFKYDNFMQHLIDHFLNRYVHFQRPISIFFVSLTHYLFKDNFIFYLITFFITFLLTNFLIFKSIKLLLINSYIPKIFLILSLTPFLNSTFLQSPYLFAEFILPVFFWSISFYLLMKSLKNNLNYFLVSHFFLLISLFCTVISFPLFILNLVFPYIYWRKNISYKKYFIKIALPIFLVFIAYFSYLLILTSFLETSVYGLSKLDKNSLNQGFYFFLTVFIEIPLMLVESLKFSELHNFIIIFFLVSFYIYILNKNGRKLQNYYNKNDLKLYLGVIFLSLLANFLIFLISNYPAMTYGTYNRMLVSTFISFCLFFSFLLSINRSFLFLLMKIVFITLILNSSKVITNQIQEIEKIKNKEIKILTQTLENYKSHQNKILLAARLPMFLENNFNNLEIFYLRWELKLILNKKNLFFEETYPISNEILNLKGFNENNNIFLRSEQPYIFDPDLNTFVKSQKSNYDLYLYVNKNKVLEFSKIKDLTNFLETEATSEIDTNLNLRQKIRLKLKSFL